MAKRKLTTIFCADVEGYGALMARDEEATLERLRRCREIMGKLFDRHQGREINTWGDAVIAEFESVVEAVRCAVAVQEALETENIRVGQNGRMRFRIGINLGDVVHENGNVYGDGVNMAARLEALAEPGGVLISETVYTMVHRQMALGFDYAGEQRVKDSDEPVSGYHVRINRRNAPAEAAEEAATQAPVFAAGSAGQRIAGPIDQFVSWFQDQSRPVKFSAGMIIFFAAINTLFTGIATPWFIFPSAPFALYILMNMRAKRKREEKATTLSDSD